PAAIAFQQGLKFRLVLEESQFGLPLELQQQAGQQNGPDGHLRAGDYNILVQNQTIINQHITITNSII
ncbi:hypothetical protein, partial [Phocaeicola sp.]|uniref:hypothetical protein n=1 Tax=Phocaeicola sp. TaxID=2773926 RepID=UPI003AB2C1B3